MDVVLTDVEHGRMLEFLARIVTGKMAISGFVCSSARSTFFFPGSCDSFVVGVSKNKLYKCDKIKEVEDMQPSALQVLNQ